MGPAKTLVWHLVFECAKIINNVICAQNFFKFQDFFQDCQGKPYRFLPSVEMTMALSFF